MARILCIETGTNICSVALAQDGELVSLRESGAERDHARNLGVFIDEILVSADLSVRELDAVAVSGGPGSYTGLRIGVSLAKGLCYGASIPLISVGSLRSLANVMLEDYQAGIVDVEDMDKATICPMIDARRMEVYAEVFDSRMNSLQPVGAHVIDADSFGDFIKKGEFVIFGDGAQKCLGTLPPGVKYVEVTASARGLVRDAFVAFEAGSFEDTAYYEPFYLKDFVVMTSAKRLF